MSGVSRHQVLVQDTCAMTVPSVSSSGLLSGALPGTDGPNCQGDIDGGAGAGVDETGGSPDCICCSRLGLLCTRCHCNQDNRSGGGIPINGDGAPASCGTGGPGTG